MLGIMAVADWLAWRERKYRAAVERRLRAFEHGQRIRETASARRTSYEINRKACHAYQAMLRAAVEAAREAPSDGAEQGRCQ